MREYGMLVKFLAVVCLTVSVSGDYPLPADIIKVLVDKHNEYRASVPKNTGPALPKVTWDTNIEKFADDWTKTLADGDCKLKHSTSDQRRSIPGWKGKYVGENIAYSGNPSWSSWTQAHKVAMADLGVTMWYKEIKDYDITTNKCNKDKVCGHYTQVVWADSKKIGCGLRKCKAGAKFILSCSYGPGGNWIGQKPYKSDGSATKEKPKPTTKVEPKTSMTGKPMTQKVKDAIVKKHNEYRAKVPNAATLPPPVSWDNKLEKFATDYSKKLAETCKMKHSTSEQRKAISGWEGTYVGENLAYAGNGKWSANTENDQLEMAEKGVRMWHDEIKDYHIETNKCNPNAVCGHYTQVVWATSTKIGCGISMCKGSSKYQMACVYAPGGNWQGKSPYTYKKDAEVTKPPPEIKTRPTKPPPKTKATKPPPDTKTRQTKPPTEQKKKISPKAFKEAIVKKHNDFRASVPNNDNPKQMRRMSWDRSLEKYASERAKALAIDCSTTPSTVAERKAIPGWERKYAGENIATGKNAAWDPNSMADKIQMAEEGMTKWNDEGQHYNIGKDKCTGDTCDCYKQLVWRESKRVGCGLAMCNNTDVPSYVMVCNYEPGDEDLSKKPPYNRDDCVPGRKTEGGATIITECKYGCTVTTTLTTRKNGRTRRKVSWKC